MRDFTLEERKQIKSAREKSYKKRHTYTVKVEYREGAWEIALIPRNGKRMLFCQLYLSKSTADFVAKKLIGARIK